MALSDDLIDETVEDQFEACDLQPIIRDLLADLEPREQSVITLRYGLEGPSYTLAEIGQRLGLTGRRVNQIEHSALHHLKHPRYRLRLRNRLN
ncbi:MAG: sigma-70 family RNA polymerase sigma factor [Syntrophobacteraceae bacterium]|nr:sigma-70 family RNA polymerase sigma factor [Syntrophobacteraceae bacterium]